jgi:photosystem II stability/assembly factor-like uncharacterized protein
MQKIPIIVLVGFLSGPCLSIANNNSGKWIKINPPLTSQTLSCSFFVNPANGWAGGKNGCIVHTCDSGNTWQVQKTPRNCWINSIYFHDENIGWAVGNHGTLYTTDGGSQWVQRNIGTDSMTNGYKIVFTNENIGWMAFGSNNTRYFSKTEDGGKTWSDLSDKSNYLKLKDIFFINGRIGLICAEDFLARTSDSGKTWIPSDTSSIYAITPFLKLQMIDTLIGYCLGLFGIAKTTDGGKTWSVALKISNGPGFTAMNFSCPDTGFALFGNGPVSVCRTNDGGSTWNYRPLENLLRPIWSVSFPEKQKGVGIADNGAIYRILGAGDSIFELTKGTGVELNCIDFCDAMHGFAGTGDFYFLDSALLNTSDGGTTWNKMTTPLKRIQRLLCFDSNTIIIYSQDSITHTLRSTDGGRNWQANNEFDYFQSFKKIKNAQNAAYILTSNTNECFITLDAGKSWINKGTVPRDTVDSMTSYRKAALFFLNVDTAWALGLNIHMSSNGGSTWESIFEKQGGWNFLMTDIYFSSAVIGWIVGYDPNSFPPNPVYIYHTNDGGRTWRRRENITFFPNYFLGRDAFFNKIHATNDGKRVWVLDEWNGIVSTSDGGEHWSQDTIPATPGCDFSDLEYNQYTNTLWLTSKNTGIWKYEIPSENVIKNPPMAIGNKTTLNVISTKNGIVVPPRCYSDKITLMIFNISGRLVFSKTLANSLGRAIQFVPLSFLPSGHYFGHLQYHVDNKIASSLFFNANIMK